MCFARPARVIGHHPILGDRPNSSDETLFQRFFGILIANPCLTSYRLFHQIGKKAREPAALAKGKQLCGGNRGACPWQTPRARRLPLGVT